MSRLPPKTPSQRTACARQSVNAFLAPDIVRAIVEGRQPVGLTSSYLCLLFIHPRASNLISLRSVLPSSSVGEMTLRLYGALSYSPNSARDLRCALNGA